MGFFLELPTPLQALVATFFTWAATALGAAVVRHGVGEALFGV